jgi:hypothetical protein
LFWSLAVKLRALSPTLVPIPEGSGPFGHAVSEIKRIMTERKAIKVDFIKHS